MPRLHWAKRCRARSSRTRLPCRAWAVRGAYVCVTHGGALEKTREEATFRLVKIAADRAFRLAYGRWQKQLVDFHAQRILITSDLLGIPPEQVDSAAIVWCHVQHGVPPLDDQAPRIGDVPLDGRLRRSQILGGSR